MPFKIGSMKIKISSGNSYESGPYGFFTRVIVMTLATILAAYLLPGVGVDSVFAAIITAVVIALLDNFIRPILIVITLPVTVIILGLFIFVINALLIMLASGIVPGFHVNSFGDGLLFSLLLTGFNYLLELPNRWLNKRKYKSKDEDDSFKEDLDKDEEGFDKYEEIK